MPAAFDCPQCGAPLSFEPKPGDKTVECPYCHETVMIPKELRTPLSRHASMPAAQTEPLPARPKRRTGLAVALVSIVVIITCVVILFAANLPDRSTAGLSSDITLPTASDATASARPVLDNTTATAEAAATSEALQPMLASEQKWPVSLKDSFTDNSHKWLTGDVRDSYIYGNRSIQAGTYTWKVTTLQSTSDFAFPEMTDLQDFYASVDMKLVSMPDDPDADAGMVFRDSSSDSTWYYFSVNAKGQYYFGWYDGSDWYTLIPETDSSASYHLGQTNRLTVGVQGSQFIFLINGQVVDHFVDDNLKSGMIGLGVNLPKTGDKAAVEFSNFTVLSAAANP